MRAKRPLRAVCNAYENGFLFPPCEVCGKLGFSHGFPHMVFAGQRLWKTPAPKFQRGEALLPQARNAAENKFLASAFFSKKRLCDLFSPQIFPLFPFWNTSCITQSSIFCGKLGGKSGKHCGKPHFFFTKSVENPVEKVKKSFQTGYSSDNAPKWSLEVPTDFLEWAGQT